MSTAFAYALTRLHARMADRAGDRARERLEAVDDFGHFLQQASRAGFEPWLKNLGTTSGVHGVEYALREAYRERLRELAGWLPTRWQPAVEWLALAPDLPVLVELLQHGRHPAWMARDPKWSQLPEQPAAIRKALLERWPELKPFGDDELAEAWLCRARALLPALGRHRARTIETLLKIHLEPGRLQLNGPEWLIRVFRRDGVAQVRVLAWTGLERLDFEFLRGHLVRRRLQVQRQAGEAA
jgi:hypothetical protein